MDHPGIHPVSASGLTRPLLRVPAGLATGKWQGGCTTRIGFPAADQTDDSRSAGRGILAAALRRPQGDFAWLKQVHGAEVLASRGSGPQGEADALTARGPGTVLLISVADCCPVLLWEERGDAFAAVHAGWRGLVAGVIPRTIEALERDGVDPRALHAWIGPSIAVEHFEVGEEVAQRFDPAFVLPAGGARSRPHVDLKGSARHQLLEAGLEAQFIDVCPDCTFAREELYWSYRRDGGICGRLMAYVGMRAQA